MLLKSIGAINSATTTGKAVDFSDIDHKYLNHKGQLIITDNGDLRQIVRNVNKNADLNCLDVSRMSDMSEVFMNTEHVGDISGWSMGNVRSTSCMFKNSKQNSDISGWDMSNVMHCCEMFAYSNQESDLSKWKFEKAENYHYMFLGSKCLFDVSNWHMDDSYNMIDGMFEKAIVNPVNLKAIDVPYGTCAIHNTTTYTKLINVSYIDSLTNIWRDDIPFTFYV